MDRRHMMACARHLAVAFILLGSLVVSAAPDSRLIDQYGHRVGSQELSGHWLLVYFGYTACPDICPTALTTMTAVVNRLDSDGVPVTPLFVSVDPERDSPARLREFAAHFHPRLRALTGDRAALADAARSFGVPWKDSGGGIDHGVMIYLAAPDGRVLRTFHSSQSVAEILVGIRATQAKHSAS
jgi:protein SCO1/2